MQKILVASVGVLIVGTANAANIINGNPLYSPSQGRFYNILTPLEVNSKFDRFVMADEFGYGMVRMIRLITQNLVNGRGITCRWGWIGRSLMKGNISRKFMAVQCKYTIRVSI